MNWPILKDIKWLAFQLASTLLAVTAVILAIANNSYWVLFVILSMVLTGLGTRRAAKLTR